MKHCYLFCFFILFCTSTFGQGFYGAISPNSKNPYPTIQNGSGSLGQTYNKTACGLNFAEASIKLGKRFHNASASSCVPFDGVTQPATLSITDIPACSVIDKAFLWCDAAGNGAALTATLQNPLGGSANFPMTQIGTSYDMGWGSSGTYAYRADVTSIIAGNGNYLLSNLPTFSTYPVTGNDVTGATLIIIYRDLSAAYSGTLVINDGCMVDDQLGNTISTTVSGFSTCSTSQNGLAFVIVSDMQDVACYNQYDNQITIGTTTYVAQQEDWWNAIGAPITVVPGQTSLNFYLDPSIFAGILYGTDRYDFVAAGVYFQNTSCTVCTPTNLNIGSSTTAANCGASDGTATATPSGGSIPYTYSWSNGQTTQTATGLAAGAYTVTVSDAGGCTATKSFTVTGGTPPTISISPTSSTICNGNSVSLTASGGSTYSWSPSTGLSANTGANVTASPTSTTTYTVTGTNGSGCSNTSTIIITVNPKPTVGVSPSAPALCNGQSTSLTASGASTYSWNPSTGLSAGTGTTVTANPTSTTTYTVIGTNGNGCTNTTTVTVTVNAKPTINVSPAAPAICNGQSVNLTASGGSTYSWFPTSGLSSGTGTTVSSNTGTTTIYTVTGTDANGCSNTASVTVTVNAKPTITVTPSAPVICNGQSVSLTGGGGSTYVWNPTSGLSSGSGTNVSANPTSTSVYTVTGTDANGCTNTSSVTVTVNAKPTITVSPTSPTICNGQSVSLTGGGGTSYVWSPTTGLSSGSGTVVSANPTSTSTYVVTGSDANGCTNTASVTVSVNAKPAITASPTSPTICNGQSVTLTGGGGNTYAWSPGTGLSATTGSVVSASPTSTTSYTVTGTDANGCSNVASVTVNVNAKPTITVNPPTSILCNGQSVTLTAGGGTSFVWSPSSGLSSGSGAVVSANPASTTVYTVIGTDANGCTNTSTTTVNINPKPTIGVTPAAPVLCTGQSTSLTASGGTSYVWSPSTGLSSGSGAVVSANPSSTTTYTVTGTDANGCTNTTTVAVTVNSTAVITATPNAPVICNGQSVSLTAGGGNTYTWSPTTGLSSGTGATVSANPTTTTVYTVTGTAGTGCSNTATVTVTVIPKPTVTVTPVSTVLCEGQSVSLTAGGGTSYVWSPSTGLSSGSGANVSASPITTTTYTVIGTDANGCSNTASTAITVNAAPTIGTTPTSASICNGQSTSITASGGTSYVWAPSTGLSSGTGTVVSANPASTTTYTVIGTNANGCTNTSAITVTVNAAPSIGVTPTTPAICNGKSVSLNANGGSSYTWSPTTGLSSGTGASVTADPTSTTVYTVTGTNGSGCSATATTTVTVNALPVVSVSPNTPAICTGTPVSLTANGGTTYTWSPTSGLSSGSGTTVSANPSGTSTYVITGTDANGCTNTASVTITVNALPTVNASPATAAICAGQSTGITASGATSYIWSPTTGLSSGSGAAVSASPSSSTTYTVTGTDGNGCNNTASSMITVNPLPVVNAGPDATICPTNSTQLTVTGPPAGSTYVWTNASSLSCNNCFNPTASPATDATYIVSVTSPDGCNGSDTVKVFVTPLSAQAEPVDTIVCYGSTVMLRASGGTGYDWQPTTNVVNPTTATPLATPFINTTYTVTVTNGNCSATATATINVYPEVPVPVITQSLDTLYCSQYVSYVSYQWYFNNIAIPNATLPYYKAPQSGNYNVAVVDTNGCSTSVGINIVLNVGLNSFTSSEAFTISPNPATTELYISGKEFDEARITVFNAIGEKVMLENLKHSDQRAIDISNLSAGVYFITIEQANSRWISKFIKQ